MSAPLAAEVKPGLWHRLYHGETSFDFVGKRRIGYTISLVLILISLVGLGVRGLNLSLDFVGGVSWEVPTANVSQDDVRSVLSDNGINGADAKIQKLSGVEGDRWRVQTGSEDPDVVSKVQSAFADKAQVSVSEVSVASVSASWGSEITKSAVKALIVFFIAIAIYISIRFEWRMAIASLLAVVHDVIISVGFYAVFQFEVTPATVIAFLTILGFSLYDTIVVFDKVHENTKALSASRVTFGDIINLSMNQVLMRSINTSIAAVLPVLSLLVVGAWILGAIALQDFSLALAVGLFAGSYSSIFVATPLLWDLKRHEAKWKKAEERAGAITTSASGVREANRAADTAVPAPAAARPVVDGEPVPATTSSGPVTVPAAPAGLGHPPRPRKKTRR